MAKKVCNHHDYLDLPYIISIIFAIIPITSWIFGGVVRKEDGMFVAAYLRWVGLGLILWPFDLINMIRKRQICRIIHM